MTVEGFNNAIHYKSMPVDALQVRTKARAAYDLLSEALEEAHTTGEGLPNCDEQPELWADYDDKVTPDLARLMCEDCPLFDMCRNYAMLERPNSTVMGGINFRRRDWEHD